MEDGWNACLSPSPSFNWLHQGGASARQLYALSRRCNVCVEILLYCCMFSARSADLLTNIYDIYIAFSVMLVEIWRLLFIFSYCDVFLLLRKVSVSSFFIHHPISVQTDFVIKLLIKWWVCLWNIIENFYLNDKFLA